MAATSLCQETRVPHCLTSDSLSFADTWSSLFSSFSDQHISLQTPDQLQGVSSYTDHSIPFTAGAAVHQSAVFAALFEEVVTSQSCEPLGHVQQPRAASSHSSAVSLCDSAASFSFKTARQSHTAAAGPALSHDTLQPQPDVWQPVASLDVGKAGLSVTFKDWQLDTDLQPEATLEDTVQPSVQETHAASSWKQRSNQHSYSKWQAAKRMHSAEQQAAVKTVSRPDAASKRARDKLNAAQHKGIRVVKPWNKQPSPIVVAGGSLKPSSSPITASQAMHMHLNKVAWWLDLQASQSLGQLPNGVPNGVPCDPLTLVPASAASTAVVEHDSPAALHSGLPDAAVHAKLPSDEKVLARNMLPWDNLSSTTRAQGSRQQAEGTLQPPKGGSQGLTVRSHSVDETGSLQQGAEGTLAPPMVSSQDGLTSAALTGSPGSLTVPLTAASPAQTSCGPELQTSSEHEAHADSKAGHALVATKRAADESRQHANGIGWLQVGDWKGQSSVPSASTELFLRLEAAAAHEPEAAAAGLQDSSQQPAASVHAHAASGHHAASSMLCMAPPMQAQLPVAHVQQPQQQQQQQHQQPVQLQQQMLEQEEDVYAGLERGSDTVPILTPSQHSAVTTPELDQAQQAPASGPKQDPIGLSRVPQQGPSGMTPDLVFSRKSPEHGSLRHRDRPRLECQAERNGTVTPKAAEAPLLKQGSYAVAAKVARLRRQRRQQEVGELNGSQRQVQLAAGGKHPALQAAKHVPTQRGLLIGSYAHPAPSPPAATAAASSANANSHLDTVKDALVFPTLSPLSSRPSTVSANRRYASTLATETSQSGSEAASVAGSAAAVMWEDSWGQVTAPCAANSSNRSRKGVGAAQSQAGLPAALHHPASLTAGGADRCRCQAKPQADAPADARASAPRKKAEFPCRRAESASSGAHSRSSAKLKAHTQAHMQAHMQAQQPCKLPVTPPLLRSARVSPLATQPRAISPEEEEESRLLASLQRLDCKLSGTPKHGSRYEPKQAQQAESSSSRVPSAAQDSPLPASASSRQRPLLPQYAEISHQARLPPSTPEVMALPTAEPAGKRHSRRVSGVTPMQAGTHASPPDVAIAKGTVDGGQARCKACRTGAVQARKGSRRGTSRRDVHDDGGQADVSNSAEQQALQQSLAKLDARLPYLTARRTGFQSPQSPTSLPSCLSAPITRQSSFLNTQHPRSVMHPLPSPPPLLRPSGHMSLLSGAASPSQRAEAARQQGRHCPLPARASPGSWAGSRQQTGLQGGGMLPDAPLMLPELSRCPSVASAPCTSGSSKPRRHPGLPDKAPGSARAALLARSRIPRPGMAANVPPQQQYSQQQQLQQHQQQHHQQQHLQLQLHQQQQLQPPQQLQQQQQQLGMPAGSMGPIASSYNQPPVSQDPYQYLSQQRLGMPSGRVGLHQLATTCVQAASVTAGGRCIQRAEDHQYLQPQMLHNASGQQQNALASHTYRQASACEAQGGFQQGYQQQQQCQRQHQRVWQQQQQQQVSLLPLAGQLQHQRPLPQPFGQHLQQGQCVPATATPCVQRAWWYPPPLTGPCIASEHMQQLHLGTSVSRAQPAITHMPLPQFGTSHADMLGWTGPDGQSTATDASEAANTERPSYSYNCSPMEQGLSQLQQQQQRAQHKQGLHVESSAVLPTTKGQKGVIKAYNLKALLS